MINWYDQSTHAFILVMAFTGLMYYLIPKVADRPLYSYKLTIVHFWSLLFLLICVSSNQLHYTTIPEWASTLGMLCGVMLWMPSWAGLVNGFCTLSGSWDRVKWDPALRFLVAGLVVFGITSLDSSILSIKSVHARLHYTDWELGHSDAIALGWVGMMTYGMIYWMMPRMVSRKSLDYGNVHFGLALTGLLVTVVPEYASGLIQAAKWSQLSELGKLQYSFVESLQSVSGFWWLRSVGGAIYFTGSLGLAIQLLILLRVKSSIAETKLPPQLRPIESPLESEPPASPLAGKPVLENRVQIGSVRDTALAPQTGEAATALCIIDRACFMRSKRFAANPHTGIERVHGADCICSTLHAFGIAGAAISTLHKDVRVAIHKWCGHWFMSPKGTVRLAKPESRITIGRRCGANVESDLILAREGGGKQSSFWHWRHFENASAVTKETVMPVYRPLTYLKASVRRNRQTNTKRTIAWHPLRLEPP